MKNTFKTKKKYGQNFLISESIAKRICQILNINDQNILEVGTGNLALTKNILLAKPKKFVSIDIDKEIVENNKILNQHFANFIMNHDALKFDEENYFQKQPFSIISNLPFNISSKLLIKWLKLQHNTNLISSMVLMFQKELAERIISSENSKKYGRLSILSQSIFNIKKEILVKKDNFRPIPKVDALVICFTPIKKLKKLNFKRLEEITSIFFNSRRKKNEKKIKKIFNKNQIKANNLDELYNLRPENISKEIYFKMANL